MGGGLAEKNLILYPEKGKDNFKTVFRIRILADAGFSNDPDPGFINSEPDLEKTQKGPESETLFQNSMVTGTCQCLPSCSCRS